jgi:acyl-CoA thioesterase FadM
VHAECDFKYPLRFEDSVEIRLLVRELREKSIVYAFVFRKLNEETPRLVARGSLAVACVKRDDATGKLTGVPVPKIIAEKIDAAPPEMLNA